MTDEHHVAQILEDLLGEFFPEVDWNTLGRALFLNVYTFLRRHGHPEPRCAAMEIIADVAWKTSKMLEAGMQIENIQGWLFKCCQLKAIDELRKKRDSLEPMEDEILDQIFLGRQIFSGQFVDYTRANLYIRVALGGLTPKQRKLVWFDQIERLPKEEIMDLLNIEQANHYRALKSKALRALSREVSALADPFVFERRMQELAKKSDEDE